MHEILYGLRRFRIIANAMYVLATLFLASQVSAQGIKVDRQTILHNGKVLRGFHAVYLSTPRDQAEIEQTLDKMQNDFGLKGFTLEVSWSVVEPSRGEFWFPPKTDDILAAANRRGMVVNILLSGHNTPSWVYKQGIDVSNKYVNDITGQKVDASGQWLNYSPSSPAALEWLGLFQKKAVEHYKTKPAVISFNVTNETTYGKANWIDYSTHAQSAWNIWRAERSMSPATMPLFPEEPFRPDDWRNWMLFRQDNLNKFFNTTYRQARSGLSAGDSHLVFHRHQWYSASDAFSDRHGLYCPVPRCSSVEWGENPTLQFHRQL
ncbi:MAG TPA: beta-galactosidase [Fibrobacteria bacterium]|nr:beta-galactosidase [Fibrobacteria bacterium]